MQAPPRFSIPGCTLLLAILAPNVHGQAKIDPPVRDRPADFSWIVGSYTITSSADKKEVFLEQPVRLKVTIQGKGPPAYQPQLDKLKIFPEGTEDRFFIEPLPEETRAAPDDGTWEFVFRLRPRTLDVSELPYLNLRYYHPGRKRYELMSTREIPLQVKPIPKVEEGPVNVPWAPKEIFLLRGAGASPGSVGRLLYIGAFVLPPVACVWWWLRWKRRHPDEARLRAARRSRAAREAIARLSLVDGRPEDAKAAAVRYLQRRVDLPVEEAAGSEVAKWLLRRGVDKALAGRWRVFLDGCDRERFGADRAPSTEYGVLGAEHPVPSAQAAQGNALTLASQAIHLIHDLEAEPCCVGLL